jgi:hypothetical protein
MLITVGKRKETISFSIDKLKMPPVDNWMITEYKSLITSWTRKRVKSYQPYSQDIIINIHFSKNKEKR